MPDEVWLLWYDNQVDEPTLISVHKTQEGANKAMDAWVEVKGFGYQHLGAFPEKLLD